jgi:hypothetical protein
MVVKACGVLVGLVIAGSFDVAQADFVELVGEWEVPHPTGVAVGPDGAVWVLRADDVVERLGSSPRTIDGLPEYTFALAIDSQGKVIVSSHNQVSPSQVQVFSSNGEWLAGWGSYGSGPGQFRRPLGIALDSEDILYVADHDNERVQRFALDGSYLGEFPTPLPPRGIAVGPDDVVWVLAYGRVDRFSRGGEVLGAWEPYGHPLIHDETLSADVYHVAIDDRGQVYMPLLRGHESLTPRIGADVFGADGAYRYTIGLPAASGMNGRVAFGGEGRVHITDYRANRVYEFGTNGVLVHSSGYEVEFRVDGVAFPASAVFDWAPGTTHTVSVDPQRSGAGFRHEFAGWSDGGEPTHSISSPESGGAAFFANWRSEYELTVTDVPGGEATVESGWHAAGTKFEILALPHPGWVFDGWEGSGLGSESTPKVNPTVRIRMNGPITQTPIFRRWVNLTVTSEGSGHADPAGTTSHLSGLAVSISASAGAFHRFAGWIGTGQGSYTGPDQNVTIVMNASEDVTQHAVFVPDSVTYHYELAISASGTDPFVQTAPATGGPRELHLWVSCAETGLAALEAGVSGSLPVLAFNPANGVFNVATATELRLAVGGCPSSPYRLGSWWVDDRGGELCLVPSVSEGILGVVDCAGLPTISVPGVRGFSSSSVEPCRSASCSGEPAAAAVVARLDATETEGAVRVSWSAVVVRHLAGVHVDRSASAEGPWDRLTMQALRADARGEYVDREVLPGSAYFYRVALVLADGEEEILGPAAVRVARAPSAAAPLETDLRVTTRNPFRGEASFSWATPVSGSVQLGVFDVAGRRVRTLVDAIHAAGVFEAHWDGRDNRGTRVPAGVYFVRLSARDAHVVQRVVLTR